VLTFPGPQAPYVLLSENGDVDNDLADEVLDTIPDETVVALSETLVEIARESPDVEIEEMTPQVAATYEAAVRTRAKGGTVRTLYFVSVRDAATASLLPVLALAGACIAMNPIGGGLAVAGLLHGLWGKLKRLRRPEDGDALDLFEKINTLSLRQRKINDGWISTGELSQDGILPIDRLVEALKKLHNKGLLSAEWAEQGENFTSTDNRWRCAR
jgi:hypothetical protein